MADATGYGQIEGARDRALELFRENPFWTTTGIARRLGIAFTTAGRAIERLQAAGIVSPTGDAQRNRVFCATQMLEVLGPAVFVR